MPAPAGTERPRRRGGLAWSPTAPVVHTEDSQVLLPIAEPSSPVSTQVVRCDEVAHDGVLHRGDPELVLDASHAPLSIADVDALIERLTSARGRMATLGPSNSPKHQTTPGSPR